MIGRVLGLPATDVESLLREAGYGPFDPYEPLIRRRDPYVLAAAADVLVQDAPDLKRAGIAYPERRLIKVRPTSRVDIFRENAIHELWHVLDGDPEGQWHTFQSHHTSIETSARTKTLLTCARDEEIDFLLSTNAPMTLNYYAGRFGITVRGMNERMKLRGQAGWLETEPRLVSGLARRGMCPGCGRQQWLSPHHTTYVRLGREWDGDGVLLCWDCHKTHH